MLNHDLLMIADAVAREKNIEREDVLLAMESALQRAATSKYGLEKDIRAVVDRRSGAVSLWRYLEIVELVEDSDKQMAIKDAKFLDATLELGDFHRQELPPIDFGRIAAQSAKQVIVQRVRESERRRQFDEYKDRVGEIISGQVKRIEYGNVTVDLGRGEAILKREEIISRETFRHGDRIRAYIYDVREELRGPQIFLSRTHPQFMAKLFTQEVPEIYEGTIDIVNVARDPGSRAKIAVTTKEPTLDPVGSCVGMRGSRVQAVVNELQGEKVDIIHWSTDMVANIVAAMTPANVTKVVLLDNEKKVEVVVPDDQLSLAIGRRGQNVRLASMLIGLDIDVMTVEQETEKRQVEFSETTAIFQEALDVDDILARLLINEGFRSVEQLVIVPTADLANIEGFDEDLAGELQNRAQDFITVQNAQFQEKIDGFSITDDLRNMIGLTPAMLVRLGEHAIITLEDFADLSSDELVNGEDAILLGFGLTQDYVNGLIIDARVQMGWIDAPSEDETDDDSDAVDSAE